MKSIKTYILLGLLSSTTVACNDWFDGALPKDEKTEEVHFKDELSITTVLNGFYTTMAGASLYGSTLSKAEIDLMAHYYYYSSTGLVGSAYQKYMDIGNYDYTSNTSKNVFSAVWTSAYSLIYEINRFIKQLDTNTVLSEEKRRLYQGEAYGLRAYIHFDLFRLFSGTDRKMTTQMIPYNQSAEVIPHSPVGNVTEFKRYLTDDLEMAKELLKDDPIKEQQSLLSLFGNSDVGRLDITERFYSYSRNYRFNFYAASALEARIEMFFGETEKAAQIAQGLLEKIMGADKASERPFYWTDKTAMEKTGYEYDYICYSEVVFGIIDDAKYTRWDKMTSGSSAGSVYSVSDANLRNNIYRNDLKTSNISAWEDIRAHQWRTSAETANKTLVSNKFAQWYGSPVAEAWSNYMQPMLRMSEMYLITVEQMLIEEKVTEAVTALNNLRFKRGSQFSTLGDPANVSKAQAYDILETEYYKEFYGEGQTFFFLKRRQNKKIIDPTGESEFVDISLDSYVVPIPEAELNN